MIQIIQHNQDSSGIDSPIFKKNPWENYIQRFRKNEKKLNPVHEIVTVYFQLRGWENFPKTFYKGRNAYPKLAKEAKDLYEMCDKKIDDALWCLDKMKYLADRGGFDWTIRTCLKHNLI